MRGNPIEELAKRYDDAFYSGEFDTNVDISIDALTLDDAYKVQDAVIRARMARGEHIVGYKVGCTSDAIRRQFGLKAPIHGRLMAPHLYMTDRKTVSWRDYVNCAIEPEFVFCLGSDLAGDRLGSEDLIDAIAYVSPGIEIHHCKFWFTPPTSQELIASNGIHAGLVVGTDQVPARQLDFQTEVFRVFKDDTLVAEGTASEIMGGAINSLRWLVGALARRGERLKAGQWVIPGSPVELVEIKEDTTLRVEISNVGRVVIDFATQAK